MERFNRCSWVPDKRLRFIRAIRYNPGCSVGEVITMRRIFFLTFVAVFLLEGTLLACLNPSFKKIITAVPMACCAKVCQKKTSPEEAQTACNATAIQTSIGRGFIKTATVSSHSPLMGLTPFFHQPAPFLSVVYAPKSNDHFQYRQPLPLYLISHAFLI